MTRIKENILTDVKKIVNQCDRCGACQLVCPLYDIKDVETACARGKNNIARGLAVGGLSPTPEILAAVNFCLLCRACVDNCPSKIKTDEAMIGVRQYFADKSGVTIKNKAMGGMLKRRTLVKLASGALGLLRKSGINRVLPNGLIPDEYTRRQFLTATTGPANLGPTEASVSLDVSPSAKVAYFHGCGMRMMFPEAAKETLAILSTVTSPKLVDNVCCGLPHLAHGLQDDFLELAKENIHLYEESDIIICDCASCGSMLRHLAFYLADDTIWKDRALAFSRKVMDLTEYLVKVGYKPRSRVDVRVTYHEPCHLTRGLGIKREPRELLRQTGNFVEMAGADVCCGGAGSFHMDYPEISDAMLDKKRRNIENTDAKIVVTECPVCLIQMSKASERSGGKFKAMHISQVI